MCIGGWDGYRAMGRASEAKAEFDKASSITKAADTALVDKISNGHAKATPAAAPGAPDAK